MTATVAHRCALCSEVLSTDPNASGIMLDVVTVEHHAVCPARPIEVGDYVRWERPSREMWAEGEVVQIWDYRRSIRIDVKELGGKWRCYGSLGPSTFDGPHWDSVVIRRIPRLAEAKATCEHPLPWQGGNRGWICQACGQPTGRTLDDAIAKARASSAEANILRNRQPPPPAPVLVDPLDVRHDGITLRILIAQDRCNSQEAGPPLFRFTPAQRAAVSAHWSAALRTKVAASDEAERNRVRVDLQDEP